MERPSAHTGTFTAGPPVTAAPFRSLSLIGLLNQCQQDRYPEPAALISMLTVRVGFFLVLVIPWSEGGGNNPRPHKVGVCRERSSRAFERQRSESGLIDRNVHGAIRADKDE